MTERAATARPQDPARDPLIPRVAYFCMEYGVSAELPIYAGGLGVLAGDYVKAVGDVRLPVTSIGILWSEGYTRQKISASGTPVDEYPSTPRDKLSPTGARVTVRVRGKDVALTAHRVELPGVAPLLLLEPIDEADRWITRRLYGGGDKDRVAQEIVLGVGGVRLLRALGIDVDIYHFNEGHAVFAGLELMRERMDAGLSFQRARAAVRNQVVFTTHTPVIAGNETHPIELLVEQGAAIDTFTPAQLAEIGGDPFGMTVAGLRLAFVANAVAELHAVTARKMWEAVTEAAPIVAVTNGVHPATWQDPRMRLAYAHGTLWETHQTLKHELLDAVRAAAGVTLDPERLLIGFARRAAPYKRSDLILRDPTAMEPLLAERKLQIIFSGKAHPADGEGKRIIANLVQVARQHPGSVIFLEGYDLALARLLVRGCDVWLNNPRRPLEASGTSGMKAAMNGVLNLSILDGWWPEACEHRKNGWQISDDYEGPGQDERDLASLMTVLTGDVLPAYYGERAHWVAMMRASIEMSQWRFSSYRMVEDYYAKMYRRQPAADASV